MKVLKVVSVLACVLAVAVLLASCPSPGNPPPSPSGASVTTIAGLADSLGSTDGTGSEARFYRPNGIATDGTNLYIADRGQHTIRKIVIATRVVTTLAGGAGISGTSDGTGTEARFNSPYGIATDGINLYVADTGSHTIRQIVNGTAAVTTLAGEAGVPGSSDGTGAAAHFDWPYDVATDGTNVYVGDRKNHTIRKVVIATGVVTTLAGQAGVDGNTDGTGTAASFGTPKGITTDLTNLYVADEAKHTIRQIVIASAAVTTLAGTAGSLGSADGIGTAAQFTYPDAIATDGTNLYVADAGNHTIRKIVISTAEVTTLAGMAGVSGTSDGIGASARFDYPEGILVDGTDIYVTDTYNATIRLLTE